MTGLPALPILDGNAGGAAALAPAAAIGLVPRRRALMRQGAAVQRALCRYRCEEMMDLPH